MYLYSLESFRVLYYHKFFLPILSALGFFTRLNGPQSGVFGNNGATMCKWPKSFVVPFSWAMNLPTIISLQHFYAAVQ